MFPAFIIPVEKIQRYESVEYNQTSMNGNEHRVSGPSFAGLPAESNIFLIVVVFNPALGLKQILCRRRILRRYAGFNVLLHYPQNERKDDVIARAQIFLWSLM